MTSLVPFSFESHEIRVLTDSNGEPWFVAKEISEILGYDQTSNALKHCKEASVLDEFNRNSGLAPATKWIPEVDVYRLVMRSTLESAERFQDWVVNVLKSIRKTGRYESPAATKTSPREIREAFSCCMSIAKLIGLKGNPAALAADIGTRNLTGTSALALIDQTHLKADPRGQTYTPTEIGKMLEPSLSAVKTNRLIETRGLQVKGITGDWLPTDAASALCEWLDTNKRHSDGTPVKQLKWFAGVVSRLGHENAAVKSA